MTVEYTDMSLLPLTGLFTLLGFGLLLMMVSLAFCQKRKSKEYRELIADMYVVGMIKKFAAEDKVDLATELKDFARIEKKTRLRTKYLDEAIEEDLKEKLAQENEDKLSKNEKK